MKRFVLILLLAAAFAGCTTVRITDEGGRTTTHIENTCWKVFWFLPIASGDPEEPNADICCWFKDAATIDGNMKMLDWAMQRHDATRAIGVTSRYDSWTFLFIVKRTCWQTSAELVK